MAASKPRVMTALKPPEQRWRRIFHGDEAQIRDVRRWVVGLLPECSSRDDVLTVTAELATNAVKHTASSRDGWFAVEVTRYPAAVLVAVVDQGATSGPRVIDDPTCDSGRGLVVVRELSARTGVAGDEKGRVVWAELGWDSEST